jgi:hypothetical protein
MGDEFVQECNPKSGSHSRVTAILEAGDGVDSTAFSNITGQIMYTTILQAFENPMFVASSLVRTIPTQLNGEKIPGIGQIGDKAAETAEGMPYERAGLDEEYIETPTTRKYGFIVPVTKEAIFFDRTGVILDRARQVGEALGIKKEKLLMDMISGFGGGSTPAFNYGGKWKWKGTEYAVYNQTAVDFTSATKYFYVNELNETVLADYSDIEEAELLLQQMQDPTTQEPISLNANRTLLVVPNLRILAASILNPLETRLGSAPVPFVAGSPVGDLGITMRSSIWLYRRLIDSGGELAADAAKTWLYGDFNRAFAWMQNWPITTSQAPTNAEAEFDRDIVQQFKASMRGAPAVLAPHYVVRSYHTT